MSLEVVFSGSAFSMPYTVTCTLCSFTREIAALEDVFEFRDEHQATYGDDHVIEFELVQ